MENTPLSLLGQFLAQPVEVSVFQESVEGKRGLLREVEMGDAASKVQGCTITREEMLSAEILDGESEMVQNLILERRPSKEKSRLR